MMRRKLVIAGIALAVGLLALAGVGAYMAHHAEPLLKARVIESLRSAFHGRVELGDLRVVSWQGFEVTGGDLKIYAADPQQPLIALRHFVFHAPLMGLFKKPMRVETVRVEGMEIRIPPHGMRPEIGAAGHDKMEIVVDQIVCDDSRLVVENANTAKNPHVFELRHIELHNVGPSAPWRYEATLTNAIPRGDIQAAGNFGPWQAESPGETGVSGHYTFQKADLATIRGIGGTLNSTGDFRGKLDRIEVDGLTDTQNFTLETANRPMPLQTRFHAIVDGTTGDTELQPVQATLHKSSFTARGAVTDIQGQGHVIDLDVDIPAGRLQDFLELAVRTQPPVLNATIATRARVHIGAGKQPVVEKLSVQGRFTLRDMHFTNPDVQDKVDMLSLRAQGQPEQAKPGAAEVKSSMTGGFFLQHGAIDFSRLVYSMPGAKVNLDGRYTLDGQVFNFRGHVLTDLPLHNMVESRWAAMALRAAGALFHRQGGGADIPVHMSGTRSAPEFGVEVFNRTISVRPRSAP